MHSFDFHPPPRIVFGAGCIERLGELAMSLDVARVLVVSDPGIIAAGHTARGMASLESAGLETMLFDGVRENPTTEHVDAGLAVARDFQPGLIVGLGGGSADDRVAQNVVDRGQDEHSQRCQPEAANPSPEANCQQRDSEGAPQH